MSVILQIAILVFIAIPDVCDHYSSDPDADPYLWMEDLDSPETLAWVEAQRERTDAWFSDIPRRDEIADRLEEVFNYTSISTPSVKNGRWFFSESDGSQEFYTCYYQDGRNAEPVVFLDFNKIAEGNNLSPSGMIPSNDGRFAAWSVSDSGSDWSIIHVRNVETSEDLGDEIEWNKGGWVAWSSDNSGFYYTRYPEPETGEELTGINTGAMIYYHTLETPQEEDSLVYARTDHQEWRLSCSETPDGRYLIVYALDGTTLGHNGLFYVDLLDDDAKIVELLSDFDATYYFLGNFEETFYFFTNLNAPNGMVISIDISNPSKENWTTVIPESRAVLENASIGNSSVLTLIYSRDAISSIQNFSLSGDYLGSIELPAPGTAYGFSNEPYETFAFYTFTSFLYPAVKYIYDYETGESELYWEPEIKADLSQYDSKQVFYESSDGTRIPMFIVFPKNIQLDGSNPCILNGYGGFAVSMTPYFLSNVIPWFEMGGIYAIPCIRGGGEYGEDWHLAGIRENREVVFQDFISAAEYLINEGYTSPSKLAITGASNGGTLVAACLNRRPELFGAALPRMGVMDLLRFHHSTVAWLWIPEFGDPESPEDREFLMRISPYHTIIGGIDYPAVMITTADHDDRVVPWHSFKYGARLQAAQAGDAPILMNIIESGGHGGSSGRSGYITEAADRYAFLGRVLGMEGFQPVGE